MKLRAAVVLTALAVITGGALVAPSPSSPAAVSATGVAASSAAASAAVQSATVDEDPAPARAGRGELADVTPPGKQETSGTGALGTVVDAVLADEELPEGLATQVRVSGDRIRVEITHDDDSAAREAIVDAGGRDITEVTPTVFAADVPADQISDLAATPDVEAVGLPALLSAPPELGAAVPSAVGANGADITSTTVMDRWHSAGFTGSGIKVGIVDYFTQAAWNDAQSRGEVPAPAGTFCLENGVTCNVFGMSQPTGLHGVAVAEAIHDMAPGASLYLAMVWTNEDLRGAIDYFAANGVKIISRSLGGFYDGPGNGTGPSAELVDYAVSQGITWFNSAGNSAAYTVTYGDGSKEWRGGYWRSTWRDTDGDRWMEFGEYQIDPKTGKRTGKVKYFETMYIVCSPYFRLRWSDWSSTVPTDYDIYRISDGDVLSPGYEPNTQDANGDAPLELQDGSDSYFRCTEGEWIEVGIYRASSGSGVSKDVLELQGNSADIYGAASSPYSAGEAFTDSKNPGMAAVGAVDPVAGIRIANYSSQGPSNDGRVIPALSAGSNFTSRAYAYGGYGGRFNGTSAATPIVAGAAAVVLARYGEMTPAQLVARLKKSNTVDRGKTGADNIFGSGELAMTPRVYAATPGPKITGTRAVGSTLTAVKPTWSPTATSFRYQWYRGTTAISGATSSTYKLTTADGGARIRVIAIGERKTYTTSRAFSSYTATIAKLFTKSPTPKISGTVKVGRTLSASVGTWSPKPSFSYQWKRNGKSISGATKSSYKLTSKDAGTRITVTVTAKKSGYKTTVRTSAKTATVKR